MPSLRLAGTLALVAVLVTLLHAPASRAQTLFDPYTVQGIEVDITSGSAQAAKDQGIAEAQRQAFSALLDRLAGDAKAKLPPADGVEYVRDFTVEQERSVGNRYIASFAVRFNPTHVKRLLQSAGIQVAEGRARPVVVVPVFVAEDGRATLWDDPNPWRAAWGGLRGGGLVPMILPLGDLADIQTINASQALAGDAVAMQSLGARWRTPDVLVAAASLRGRVLDVALKAGPTTPKPFDALSYKQSEGESVETLLARAAKDVSRALDALQRQAAHSGGEAGTLSALVPLSGFNQWMAVRERLGRVPLVRRWELVSLSRAEAAIILHTAGTSEQVAEALNQGGLRLEWRDSFWTLTPVGVN
ncbi:MAG: DUF2066 domain-containing protein [Magnetospirillum sp.]|nr:DUF2066 domain-containing protein [Magnetospirillum sp.]